ncbi:MAG TPA: hypothetical protein VGE76_09770 [Opitutaceae bacterium]
MRRALIVGGLMLSVLGARAAPQLEFEGMATLGEVMQFRVAEHATGVALWVAPGGSFQGYTIGRYDAATETLQLLREGAELRLPLRAARVTDSLSPAAAAAIRANLKLLVAAAKVHFLEGRTRYATFADLVGLGKPLPQLVPIAGEDYGGITFMKADPVTLRVRTASGHTVVFDHDPAR